MKRRPPSRSKSATLVGLGVIGSFECDLLPRMPGVGHLTVIDRDRYDTTNLPSQCIERRDVGKPKAFVQAERIRRINPAIVVRPLHADVEDVPLGWLRADVLLGCLDSQRGRMVLNEAAWRLNMTWIDAGVGDGGLARVNVFRPGPEAVCYECALDERDYAAEQRYPCQPPAAPPASHSPAHVASLAASLQAAECAKFLNGQLARVAFGRQILLNAMFHQFTDTRCVHNPRCRFDHEILPIQKLGRGPRSLTLVGALRLGGGLLGADGAPNLRVPGKSFLRQLACHCGYSRAVFRLQGRVRAADRICPQCERPLLPLGFAMLERLTREAVAAKEWERPLAALGFKAGDVFTVTRGDKALHFELGTD